MASRRQRKFGLGETSDHISSAVIAVDYVCEVSGIFVPETVPKCRATFLKKRFPTLRKSRADRQRIQPQGLNFYRLSNPWRNLSAIHARIHPSELLAVFAGSK